MIIGTCLATFAAVLGFRRYKPGMQLVGSCSVAISAACHGRSDIDTTAPLQWGVTSKEGAEVGHCTFSDRAVEIPREGVLYEGCFMQAAREEIGHTFVVHPMIISQSPDVLLLD
jgi:hypothetical protein